MPQREAAWTVPGVASLDLFKGGIFRAERYQWELGGYRLGGLLGLINPRGSWECEDLGVGGGREAVRVFRTRRSECRRAFLGDAGGVAVVDIRGRVVADAGVLMVMVVPVHETADEGPGVVDRGEAIGELRPVFHGLEQGLTVRIIVGHPRPVFRQPGVCHFGGKNQATMAGFKPFERFAYFMRAFLTL